MFSKVCIELLRSFSHTNFNGDLIGMTFYKGVSTYSGHYTSMISVLVC